MKTNGPYKWKTVKETWEDDTEPNTRRYTYATGPTRVLAGKSNEVENLNRAYNKGVRDGLRMCKSQENE